MKLKDLVEGIVAYPNPGLEALEDREITGLALNSQEVASGNVFIALNGSKQHGLVYANQAVKQGAAVVIYEPSGASKEIIDKIHNVPLIPVTDLGVKLGDIAARYYDEPSKYMDVIGIVIRIKSLCQSNS